MVAIITPGEAVKGAVEYNENKVKEGKAVILDAVNYPKNVADLSFRERLGMLEKQEALNTKVEEKCLHITLSFDSSELISDELARTISKDYMEQIGFGEQPFLVYRHHDTVNPHLHIVTTSIKPNGDQIRLRYIGRDKSNPARKAIEEKYGLIKAEGRATRDLFVLKPIDLEKVQYGKSETKASISNTVRSVFKHYKFTSLAEFNAALGQFNVTAYRGEPGMEMYEKGGLVYSLIDPSGKKVGKSIKASSIFDKPMLKNLEAKFPKNKIERNDLRSNVIDDIEDILKQGVNLEEFIFEMNLRDIKVSMHKNDTGRIHGITFVDNRSHCVFKGSDLGEYSANDIIKRLNTHPNFLASQNNQLYVEKCLKETNFQIGFKPVLKGWASQKMIVTAKHDNENEVRYYMGNIDTPDNSYWLVPSKMQYYFRANGLSPAHTDYIQQHVGSYFLENIQGILSESAYKELSNMIDNCFDSIPVADYISKELLQEARKRRKRRFR